jgi:hypothetical protein
MQPRHSESSNNELQSNEVDISRCAVDVTPSLIKNVITYQFEACANTLHQKRFVPRRVRSGTIGYRQLSLHETI